MCNLNMPRIRNRTLPSILEASVDLSPVKLPPLPVSKFFINHSPAFLYNLPTMYVPHRV